MAKFSPYRIKLWDIGSLRGRGSQVATIDDAGDVGVAEFANEAGEMFFTLPMNHPQIGECDPLTRHYEVSRLDQAAGTYGVVGQGLLEDYEATANEVVFYGVDYLGLLNKTITISKASYTNQFIGTVVTAVVTAAQIANSPIENWTMGGITTTSRTATFLTSFEPRLDFLRGVLEVYASGSTERPIMFIERSYPLTFRFTANRGVDREDVRLEYGGAIQDFLYSPGWANRSTRVGGIGVKREGASVLYTTQTATGAAEASYGILLSSALFTDIVGQTELDDRTLSTAKDRYYRTTGLSMSLAPGYIKPWGGYDLGDSVRVMIERGIVSLNGLFTVWGMEWIGKRDGSESLYLDLQPKLV